MNKKAVSSILVVSNPGRRRTSLLALLASVCPEAKIQTADNLSQFLSTPISDMHGWVIMDHSLSEDELGMAIQNLRSSACGMRTLALVSQPKEYRSTLLTQTDAVLLDGFSADHLEAILRQ